jgi:hypothetical protein
VKVLGEAYFQSEFKFHPDKMTIQFHACYFVFIVTLAAFPAQATAAADFDIDFSRVGCGCQTS